MNNCYAEWLEEMLQGEIVPAVTFNDGETLDCVVSAWGKNLYVVWERKWDSKCNVMIHIGLEDFCPKCETEYIVDSRVQGGKLICSKCNAKYCFYGAMHPRPIDETRTELLNIIKSQGIEISNEL